MDKMPGHEWVSKVEGLGVDLTMTDFVRLAKWMGINPDKFTGKEIPDKTDNDPYQLLYNVHAKLYTVIKSLQQKDYQTPLDFEEFCMGLAEILSGCKKDVSKCSALITE